MVSLDKKGLYFIENMGSAEPHDPDFYEAVNKLQAAVETFIEANSLVPDLDKNLNDWEVTPGYFSDAGSAGTVPIHATPQP